MPQVTFLPYNLKLEVARGTSLLAAADEVAEMVTDDFFVGELCEGRHECGNCCVEIVAGVENLSPATEGERKLLVELRHGPTIRTCCTARVQGDVTVRILSPVKHGADQGHAQMQAHP
jgi:uncharacterized 2Fe-2S/4Fe-4S cluster protein (DUF4445 family)